MKNTEPKELVQVSGRKNLRNKVSVCAAALVLLSVSALASADYWCYYTSTSGGTMQIGPRDMREVRGHGDVPKYLLPVRHYINVMEQLQTWELQCSACRSLCWFLWAEFLGLVYLLR